jgi:hypothetical protein
MMLFFSCAERYPYFIQQPEFIESDAGEDYPGIFLSIVCEDEYAQIRYTTDGSQPTSLHGLIYEEPLYLAAESTYIRAVAVRVGYDAGPEAEYQYEPQY